MFHRTIKINKNNSFFLFGPRGTGKSTLLKAVFQPHEAFYIDLLDAEWEEKLSRRPQDIKTFVKTARCRWKVENECFNVFKNHGYCIDHNYGHGEKNLSFIFYLLTVLAFFFHQIFEMTDRNYQAARKKFGSKRHLWETLRAYIKILVFDTWETLLEFALTPLRYELSLARGS